MPELPEVETALRGVSPYLKGFTIEKIVVRQPQLRWVVSPELTTLKKRQNFEYLSSCEISHYSYRKRLYHWSFRHVRLCSNRAA